MNTTRPVVTVVGSINLDLIATAERLPTAGETIGGEVRQGRLGDVRARPEGSRSSVGGR